MEVIVTYYYLMHPRPLILFNILRDRGLCPIVLRLVMNMYTNQEIQVKWNTLLSSKCKTISRVKQ